ncbi:hypothetical protein ARMSODRAFT_977013 [Armillaria solidipes]|uniref:Uncharacterized protein n=1 Tax=Armillaria solidipes TaxID=1076256 RepID=A0A2H3B912_9AGAR|nr:hypothetical protein ARMSODRAFT_977013 [Armillaria solidipes]
MVASPKYFGSEYKGYCIGVFICPSEDPFLSGRLDWITCCTLVYCISTTLATSGPGSSPQYTITVRPFEEAAQLLLQWTLSGRVAFSFTPLAEEGDLKGTGNSPEARPTPDGESILQSGALTLSIMKTKSVTKLLVLRIWYKSRFVGMNTSQRILAFRATVRLQM